GVGVLGLSLHMFGVSSVLLKFVSGASPIRFCRGVREAMVTALAASAAAATRPTALQVAEDHAKRPRRVSRCALPARSAMSQNGTALFEGVTVLFLAQVFQVDLTIMQQALVMGVCILAGIGTAGIPAGSLPVIAMILVMVGVPPEGLGLVLGVDRLLDMCRTTVNVVGDIAAAVFVAGGKQQGDDDDQGGGELDDAEQQLRLE